MEEKKYKKLNRDSKAVIVKHVYTRTIDGCEVMLDMKNHIFHRLNNSGTVIFNMIKKKNKISDISSFLTNEYKIDRKKAEKDTIEFVAQLKDKGILRYV
ncbi:MAG: PqqD family protein [Candidatus Omnitrophica bacterium]|nr:PqqD family protein [Candidatus Omnitrophota bacterium]